MRILEHLSNNRVKISIGGTVSVISKDVYKLIRQTGLPEFEPEVKNIVQRYRDGEIDVDELLAQTTLYLYEKMNDKDT